MELKNSIVVGDHSLYFSFVSNFQFKLNSLSLSTLPLKSSSSCLAELTQNVRSPRQLLASIDEQQFIVSHKLRTYMRSSNCKYFFASLFILLTFNTSGVLLLKQLRTRRVSYSENSFLYYLRKEKVIVRHVPLCMLSLISTQFYPGIFFSFSLSKEANKAIVRVRLRITYLIENKFFLLIV